jgi:hypothetical protein
MTLASERPPTVEELVEEITELRPLGGVASAVLRLTEGDRFSAHELGTVISSDQALTAKMLRLSNSAYYGFPRRIATVRDAIVLLGFRAVRSSVLASCVIDSVGTTENIDYRQFWRNSVAVGMFGEMLSRAEQASLEEAFTAGVPAQHRSPRVRSAPPALFREVQRHAEQRRIGLHEAQSGAVGILRRAGGHRDAGVIHATHRVDAAATLRGARSVRRNRRRTPACRRLPGDHARLTDLGRLRAMFDNARAAAAARRVWGGAT